MYLPSGKTNAVSTEGDADPEYWSVGPRFFKTLVGKNHREFSTMHQQDASEYFLHLMEVMDKVEASEGERLGCVDQVGKSLSSILPLIATGIKSAWPMRTWLHLIAL